DIMGVAGNDVAEKKIQQIDTISILDKLELERQEKERQALELKVPRVYLSMAILFCINLLNYMDRYTIAGVLTNIQGYYGINDAQGGLLQTIFMVFFMICSPICGFLGDSGLGFMVGSSVAALTNDWRWGIRITAVLGVFCLLAIIIFIREPERGGAERERGEIATEVVATSYTDDLKSLVSK
ncbi:hypothetical protein GCK32_017659, partial [Trichostrongylus colubriformis]